MTMEKTISVQAPELSVFDYSEWVEKIRNNASVGDNEWGRSLLYLCFDGMRLVGLLSVRYELSKTLSEKYGDIGYGVRPSERRKGYATAMLRYALSICREKGLKRAVLGCHKDNFASAAVIERNSGVLFKERDNFTDERICQNYLINQ